MLMSFLFADHGKKMKKMPKKTPIVFVKKMTGMPFNKPRRGK